MWERPSHAQSRTAQSTNAPGSATRRRMFTPLPPGIIHVQGGGSVFRAVGMAWVWGKGPEKSTSGYPPISLKTGFSGPCAKTSWTALRKSPDGLVRHLDEGAAVLAAGASFRCGGKRRLVDYLSLEVFCELSLGAELFT